MFFTHCEKKLPTRQYLAEQPSVAYKAQELICCLNDRPALLLLINGTLGGGGACVCVWCVEFGLYFCSFDSRMFARSLL